MYESTSDKNLHNLYLFKAAMCVLMSLCPADLENDVSNLLPNLELLRMMKKEF